MFTEENHKTNERLKREGERPMFTLPEYHAPDFSLEKFKNAPDARWEEVGIDGVAPEIFTAHQCIPNILRLAANGSFQNSQGWIPVLF